MLNVLFLVVGCGGGIVSALALPESGWKYAIITFFALVGLLGLVLIARDAGYTPKKWTIWFSRPRISLYEAARRVFEGVEFHDASVPMEVFSRNADEILINACEEIARYRNGKPPLIALTGNHPPSGRIHPIVIEALSNYQFVVEGKAIILEDGRGESRYENLTTTRREVRAAIDVLKKRVEPA